MTVGSCGLSRRLQILYANSNSLSTLPASLSQCTALTLLNVANNPIFMLPRPLITAWKGSLPQSLLVRHALRLCLRHPSNAIHSHGVAVLACETWCVGVQAGVESAAAAGAESKADEDEGGGLFTPTAPKPKVVVDFTGAHPRQSCWGCLAVLQPLLLLLLRLAAVRFSAAR